MASPESRDAAVALHRQNINLRSVTRNDPSAVEILETSAYSTIYHYEDPEWEKQKMEGPTFIIRRDKSPFYAIYMLNRQTVKNVTIALIPGEIKVTVVKEDMLQIARRGEKVKRAMWFSEGEDGVERFRSKILEICGEPSKIAPQATPMAASSSSGITSSRAQPAIPSDDGFSRLFAGLMPGSSQPPEPIPGFRSGTPKFQHQEPVESAKNEDVFPEAPILQNNMAPSSQPDNTPSTGQTADDLLMSILGMAPPPRPAATSPPVPQVPSAPPAALSSVQSQGPSAPPASQVFHSSPSMPPPPSGPPRHQSPIPPHVIPTSHYASQMSPPPIPNETKPTSLNTRSPQFSDQDFPSLGKIPSRGQAGSPATYSHATQSRSPMPANRYPDSLSHGPPNTDFNHPRSVTGPPQIPNGGFNGPSDPGAGAVALTMAKQGLGGIEADNEGKRLFMDTLLRRIHTEPAFVDQLWMEYLRLTRGTIG